MDASMKLLCETASWNGHLSATIDLALISIDHADLVGGIKLLRDTLAEYTAYRDEQLAKLVEWSKQHEDHNRP